MTACRLCEIRLASVKAHVIPKSFFVEHLAPKEMLRVVSTSKNSHPKRSPIGVYDTDILCDQCEPKFSPYDNYGYEFFHPKGEFEVIFPGTEAEASVVRHFDYRLLKLFILSTLWRASVSGHSFYVGVALGPYEDEIRELILRGEPGEPHHFPISIHRFAYTPERIPILCPVALRIDGLNCYQILLNGFLVVVKVDRRPMPPPLSEFVVTPGAPLVIPSKDYKGSSEHRQMVRAAKNTISRT